MKGQILVEIVILGLLILLSAFFSGSEIALSSIDKLTLKRLMREEKRGEKLYKLLSSPYWLITILVGNNLVNIGAASIATIMVGSLVKGRPGIVIGIATGLMTFFILVFGEITPKRYCYTHREKVALWVAEPVLIFSFIFFPVVKFLLFLTQGFLGKKRGEHFASKFSLTEKEIHQLIDLGEEEGALEKKEGEMVHSALEFDETQVKEIMTPRTHMVCVEENSSLSRLIGLINEAGYSRIPVYRKRIDNIVGVAYAKDLIKVLSKGKKKNLKVKEIMRPPIFVPYTIKLSELFRKLQQEKTHLAIVVDEYGGVAGLITVEDLLEEIVGEIEDEYDRKREEKIVLLKDGSALVKGDTDIDEINEKLGTTLPEKSPGFESIGGFLFHLLGKIPKKGETVKYDNLLLQVEEVDEKSIKSVKITFK